MSDYESRLRAALHSTLPDIYENLDTLPSHEPRLADKVLATLLEYGCKGTHMSNILLVRSAVKKIPSAWLTDRLIPIATAVLDLKDDWEYRRLLEILDQSTPHLLPHFATLGQSSPNPEVREAAADFMPAPESGMGN